MTDDTEIKGQQIDLDGGRHVWVGHLEDRVLIEFMNAEGQRTRLALSNEAASALQYLLGDHPPAEETIRRFIGHMTDSTVEAKGRWQWQEVKPDTAPQVGADQ